MTNDGNLGQISRAHIGAGPDSLLAGGLVTASALGPWLAELNQVLTALSLTIGVLLGSVRLWLLLKGRNGRNR